MSNQPSQSYQKKDQKKPVVASPSMEKLKSSEHSVDKNAKKPNQNATSPLKGRKS